MDVFFLLREKIFGISSGIKPSIATVFFNIRLPRVLSAFMIGGALSLSGCVYQSAFKNPLVSPDILGASAGAGFGAAISLMLSFSNIGVQITAFLFGIVAVGLSYSVGASVNKNKSSTITLVLTGLVVSAIFQAAISLIKYLADPYSKLPAIVFWLMGSLAAITYKEVLLILAPLIIGSLPLFLLRWKINLLSLSDEEAMSMGVDVSKLRVGIIFCATLITSSVVAVSGMIGWVGLIVPHISRMIVGSNNKALVPASMIIGGIYLLIIDNVARSIMAMEIPIGILTAIIGAPFFLILIQRDEEKI